MTRWRRSATRVPVRNLYLSIDPAEPRVGSGRCELLESGPDRGVMRSLAVGIGRVHRWHPHMAIAALYGWFGWQAITVLSHARCVRYCGGSIRGRPCERCCRRPWADGDQRRTRLDGAGGRQPGKPSWFSNRPAVQSGASWDRSRAASDAVPST